MWKLAYETFARALAAYLVRGLPGASVYARGSLARGEPVYGLSDVDLAVVVTAGRRRVWDRWGRLRARLPLVGAAASHLTVLEADELVEAALGTILSRVPRSRDTPDQLWLQERPGPDGPGVGWRLLHGPERRVRPDWDRQEHRLASWLELQYWWLHAFQLCLAPERNDGAYLCVKLVSEPARVLLGLLDEEPPTDRRDALESARTLLPETAWALELEESLPRSPPAPVAAAVRALVALTRRTAETLAREVADRGETVVRLVDVEPGPPPPELRPLVGSRRGLPLADWRAVVRPSGFEEGLVVSAADATDPSVLAAAAAAERRWYVAVPADGLLLLPTGRYHAARLRSVQCPLSDPVSTALAAGCTEAAFPKVRGWAAADWARRAVEAHAAWLQSPASADESPPVRFLLASAARAALFHGSLRRGPAELVVSPSALAERFATRASVLELDAYSHVRDAPVRTAEHRRSERA